MGKARSEAGLSFPLVQSNRHANPPEPLDSRLGEEAVFSRQNNSPSFVGSVRLRDNFEDRGLLLHVLNIRRPPRFRAATAHYAPLDTRADPAATDYASTNSAAGSIGLPIKSGQVVIGRRIAVGLDNWTVAH
jgi:hypothetical protein